MGELIEMPSNEEQKEILTKKLSKSIVAGETWYLIGHKWMRSLKEFLGLAEHGRHLDVSHPGPIDNRPLIDNEKHTLRSALTEKIDFELVSEDTWNLLSDWYGVIEDTEPIARQAISNNEHYPIVEVYPINLSCYKNGDRSRGETLQVSRVETLARVVERLCKPFDIPKDSEVRLFIEGLINEPIEDYKYKKICETDLVGCQNCLVVETMSEDGKWPERHPYPVKSNKDRLIHQGPSGRIYNSETVVQIRHRHMAQTQSRSAPPGLCGLINVGNACFMNSVLQCMSNVPVITEYFLSERHLKELNISNPLGMKGEIAKAYGELIMKMWSGKYSETIPSEFKTQVGKFNPSFSGYQQHDSQELLTFLLDGLHEDLNKIKQKPYIEICNQAGKDEKIAAFEAWENYKKRNDSIIVDTFHGLLKSTVICPECERPSVTFDPFCYLSLPLPSCKMDRALTITYVPFDGSKRECKYRLILARKDTIRELCQEVSVRTGIHQDQMLVAEITQCHFHKFYGNEDSIDHIEEKDVIKVFELPIVVPASDKDTMIVPVCFWELCKPNDKYLPNHLFGIPFLITIPKAPITYDDLNEVLLEKMQRHFNLPGNVSGSNSSSSFNSNSFAVSSYSDTSLENDLERQCSLNNIGCEDSFYKIYYMDSSTNAEPKKLTFNDTTINLSDLLSGNDPPRYGRKVLILQFTSEQRRKFFQERPVVHDHLINPYPSNREKGKISINDCLSLFTTCEKLSADDAWYCPDCHKHQRATKKFDLWKLPKVLIVHLKRFSYTRYRRDKIDDFVDCPISNLCMDKYVINEEKPSKVYDLIGVCNHYGNMGAGHYTASCKNKDNGNWYNFDDNMVSPIQTEKILTNAAYVLFYIAKDCNKPPDNLDTN
ncbi:ubiquitin carboxyl-terminal hydrolase 15-like [Cimex lectularius]|uniref:Ubiquitin carboxyl-terminal hydrolase n=1 Tax=Cimex lectularius TaxID=79782 RepID=A0A8I6TJW8_CIMLE|nr:ubiquitin carboxyl-terminal hydrolase 15-like [Cimex lectularius]